MSNTTFASFGLSPGLVADLAKRGINEPFPIQSEAIPYALEGRDVKGKAPTGSGKTLAFGLPVVQLVARADRHRPRALILAPTRELAEQINVALRPLAAVAKRSVAAIYGGVGYGPQIGALRKGVDILVATPGRLEDLLEQGSVELSHVDLVVIDEADRMADMGFLPAVRRILSLTPDHRHTMLFSATLDGEVSVLSNEFQNDPVVVEAGVVNESAIPATHYFWKVDHNDRTAHTAEVILDGGRTIVFTRTRHGADRLSKQLARYGVTSVALHGGRSQSQRTKALKDFSTGRIKALIATDVAARGIHVDGVETVIHFDIPADHKDYLHRSGRTARAGAGGTVISMVTPAQMKDVRKLQRLLDMDQPVVIPDPVADLPQVEVNAATPSDDHRGSKRGERQPKKDHRHGGESGGQASPKAGRDRVSDRPSPSRSSERNGSTRSKERGSQPRSSGFQPRVNDPDVVSIYVGNIPWETTEAGLEELFRPHGKVRSATIISDRRTGRAKGYGFVDMSAGDGRRAVDSMKNARLDGRPLKVKIADQ